MYFHPKKVALEPASYTNGATASLVIDRLGQDAAHIDIILGSANNATNVPAVKLQESDITNATGYADVTGFTTSNLTPSAVATSAVTVVTANVNCVPRKRYLKLLITPVTTQVVSAIANLYRSEQAPRNASTANVDTLVQG